VKPAITCTDLLTARCEGHSRVIIIIIIIFIVCAGIRVDTRGRTSARGVLAAGDVCARGDRYSHYAGWQVRPLHAPPLPPPPVLTGHVSSLLRTNWTRLVPPSVLTDSSACAPITLATRSSTLRLVTVCH
jgi:hypothetical protein